MPAVRISDDRYSRERARMELALRFLRHEARTQTIRAWTGLSDDRIRKLYRSYMSDARRDLRRHRGKSPHQVAYFTRSLRLQEETAVLASVLSLLGVVPPAPASGAAANTATSTSGSRTGGRTSTIGAGTGAGGALTCTAGANAGAGAVPGLMRGELLCQAFEAFRVLLPSAHISFEHAVFLTTALARGDQLRLGGCADCGGLVVTERFRLRVPRCHRCAGRGQARC